MIILLFFYNEILSSKYADLMCAKCLIKILKQVRRIQPKANRQSKQSNDANADTTLEP
jgi:hypothetical protein